MEIQLGRAIRVKWQLEFLPDISAIYVTYIWIGSYHSVSRTHVRRMSRRTWNLSKGNVMYKPEILRFDTIALSALARK